MKKIAILFIALLAIRSEMMAYKDNAAARADTPFSSSKDMNTASLKTTGQDDAYQSLEDTPGK